MRRVVAVLGAVLMVVVAVRVRGVLDDGDGGGSSGGGGGGAAGDDGEVTLLCVDELEDVCEALQEADAIDDFETEPAGETVDRLSTSDEDLGADAWLSFDGFPQLTDVSREQATLGALFRDPVRTDRGSAVVIATAPDRTGAWREACGGDPEWSCLGDAVGTPWTENGGETSWGAVEIGFDGPGSSATGLLVVAQAVGAHLDDPGFASNDLSRASRWLRDLLQDVDGDEEQTLLTMITQRGSFDAVGSLANAAEAVEGSRQGDGTGIFYPAPMYAAEVVLATPRGGPGEVVDGDELATALDDERWEQVDDGVPLPEAGVLYALRELVS